MTVAAQAGADGGTTDGGSTDGGATDGGSTDGSTDGGASAGDIEMIEGFGGAVFDSCTTFTFPAGSEVWAGFANLNDDIYPFTFRQWRLDHLYCSCSSGRCRY